MTPVNLAGQRHSKQRISWQSKLHARMPVKRFCPLYILIFLPLLTPSPLLPSFQSPFPPSTKKSPHRFTSRRGDRGTTNNLIFTYRLWQRRRPRRLLHWRSVSVSAFCVSVSLAFLGLSRTVVLGMIHRSRFCKWAACLPYLQ